MIRIQAVSQRNLRERLGDELRSARDSAGLSQEGLAKRLNISRPSVASMESGRQAVSIEQLVELATLLDADPIEILSRALGARVPVARELEKFPEAQQRIIQTLRAVAVGR